MGRWKTLLVLLMSLWLPLQGVAAVVMPFCQHSLAAGQSSMLEGEHATAHGDMMDHSAHQETTPSQQHDGSQYLLTACDDCGHCNLSCASTLPSTQLQAVTSVQVAVAPYSILPALAGVVPHRLNRPPLLA